LIGTSTICGRFEGIESSVKAEQALSNDPISIYEQAVEAEIRYVYYGETDGGRLLALVITERNERIRVVTAYDLDAGQKQDYLTRRLQED